MSVWDAASGDKNWSVLCVRRLMTMLHPVLVKMEFGVCGVSMCACVWWGKVSSSSMLPGVFKNCDGSFGEVPSRR